jgi:hypothetical protein
MPSQQHFVSALAIEYERSATNSPDTFTIGVVSAVAKYTPRELVL